MNGLITKLISNGTVFSLEAFEFLGLDVFGIDVHDFNIVIV